MKRKLSVLLVCLVMVSLLAACTVAPITAPTAAPTKAPTTTNAPTTKPNDTTKPTTAPAGTTAPADPNAEIVDGRFTKTRAITVEIFDRNNVGGSEPDDNFYTDFIKAGMLRDHNVEVTFVPVGRWTEVEQLNNLLAAGDAPDVCVTYSFPTIQTYANMGGVTDLQDYVEDKEMLANLWDLLGETNMYWDKDPQNGTLWAIEAILFLNKRTNTFVREDWMSKLKIKEPTTIEEFETMLKAFKDNAKTLLGADASKMIPFSTSFDVGWRADHMLLSFVPEALSDKDVYVNGFDDRRFLFPGYKEGVRTLNKWYNDGLIWQDFALYGAGDTTEDNMMKAGYVGSFIHNWDYPYRAEEEGVAANLKKLVGEDAAYIAVECFKNDAGRYKKYLSAPVDRKVFFPATNDEPIASMMYLNWLSTLENRKFLQIGEEGITHKVLADGTVQMIAGTGNKIMNSPSNIDYTIVINGLDLGDLDLNSKSVALGYPGVDAKYIKKAYQISSNEARYGQNIKIGEVKSEEGMGTLLTDKRNAVLATSIVAAPEDFDAIFDSGMADYLSSGGQAIIDERKAGYEKYYE